MAYLLQPDEELDQQISQPQQITPGLGGAPSSAGTGLPTAPTPTPTSSGTFVNLQQYLAANQPQAQQLAGQVAGKIGQETQEAQQAIQQAKQDVGAQIQQGTVQYDPTLVEKVASGQTLTAAEQAQLAAQQAGQYAGPTDLTQTDVYQPTLQEVQQATTAAQQTGSVGGRKELLRGITEGPRTGGGLSLDQLLLQNIEPAYSTLQTAAEAAMPVQTTFQETQQNIAEDIAKAKLQSQEAATKTREQATSQIDQMNQAIQRLVEQQQASVSQQQQDIVNALANAVGTTTQQTQQVQQAGRWEERWNPNLNAGAEDGVFGGYERVWVPETTVSQPVSVSVPGAPVSDEQLQLLGINRAQLDQLLNQARQARQYGDVNLGQMIQQTYAPSAITEAAVVTPEQQAIGRALAQLAGMSPVWADVNRQYLGSPVRFDLGSAQSQLQSIIDAGIARQQQAAANQQMIAQQEAAAKAAQQGSMITGVAGGAAAGFAVAGPVGAVIGGVLGLFSCFAEGTPVVMEDGTVKAVNDIEIGDRVLLGGLVYGRGEVLSDEMYIYDKLLVSGSHAVFEETTLGYKWIRVRDSNKAQKVDLGHGGTVKVYPIVNEHMLMVTNNTISADMAEVPNTELYSDTKRIEVLNSQTERNKWLVEVIQAYQTEKLRKKATNTEVGEIITE